MIESFRHKGLRRFYEDDDRKHLPPELVERIREILTALDAAESIEGLSRPSFRLHTLRVSAEGILGRHGAGELANHFSFRERQGFRC